ncbi:MAG TPA: ABC transporter permease [Solirubrobacteraceae bacterium]|nr:ABC transporter permease [Solirubrobacteraceae bacterium]
MSGSEPVRGPEAAPAPAAAGTPLARLRRLLVDTPEIGIVIAVIAAFLIFTAKNSDFASTAELQNLGVDLAGFAILAVGESFCIITGGIDLSVGSLTAFFAVASAWINVSMHVPVLLTFVIVILAGGLWGLGHGLLITKLGLPPFVVTLVTFIFAAGADAALAPNPIPITSSVFLSIVGSTVAGVPIAVIVLLVIAIVAWFVLERTYLGRQIYAVGGNTEAARLAGIPTKKRIMLAYVISGSCASVAGIIVASHLTSGTADSVSGWELIAIASCVIGGVSLIGGQGRIIGVLAGAALLVVLQDGLVAVNVNAYYQQMVVGVVLLIAIVIDRLRVIRLERSGKRVRRVAEVGAASQVPARDLN